ncbi:MAG: siphovirus ReqiPepy6 Gp37-like family protein [Lachnospiraceae bacterium]|nr:siphovirus ReqiPepy6 Gp37-like family protein [Lachnospiraceae bacterium]
MSIGFNVIALDENYEIISLLRYTNLQWNRKYFEPGIFSLEIPLEQYDSRYKYIFTKDRPEMGEITQVNYIDQGEYRAIYLSGYFLENELNRRVVYRKGDTNIKNPPSWVNQSGNAEDVAFAFFNAFKDVCLSDSNQFPLGIDAGENQSRGKTANHERCGELLGNKIYHILQASKMSYRVAYDFESSRKVFYVWSGCDRTQEQLENNPVIFSTRYGNIKKPNVLMDSTNYKNMCIVDHESEESVYSRAVMSGETVIEADQASFVYLKSALNRNDYAEDAFLSALDTEGISELSDRVKTVNVEFDAMEGSYEYRIDFDLGDVCSIEIPEVDISADAVLIGCYEVIKKGTWSLTLEFGTPILKRR